MESRTSLNQLFYVVSTIAALVAFYELTQKAKKQTAAQQKEAMLQAQLTELKQGLQNIYAKLG